MSFGVVSFVGVEEKLEIFGFIGLWRFIVVLILLDEGHAPTF